VGAVGAVAGAAGKVFQGISARQQGKYRQKIAERNALLARRQASGAAEVQARAGEKAVGAAAARAGASGFAVSGSAVDVMAQIAAQSTQRAGTAIYDGALRSQAYRDQGAAAKRQGDIGFVTGLAGAASTLMTAAGTGKFKFLKGAKNGG